MHFKPIVVYYSLGQESTKVICNKGTEEHDYWYFWRGDCEPIRIKYENGEIVLEVHRIHWIHKNSPNPYTDDQKRIHVFFHWHAHTPQLKAGRNDRIFDVLVESFSAEKKEEYELTNEAVPDYYTCAGVKSEHFPPVQYDGWSIPK